MRRLLYCLIIACTVLTTLEVNGQQIQGDSINAVFDSVIQNPIQDSASEGVPEILKTKEWKVTIQKVFWSVILFLLTWIFMKYISKILERIGERRPKYRITIKGLIPIIRVLIWTGVLYFILASVISPPWATLITLMASAGVAIGFASQDILKNIFGGIMILFDRPFQVGDKVEIGKYYGEVTDIGIRTVRLVTADDSMITVPNNEIMSTSVSNSNAGESNCQVVAELYLPLDADLQKVKKTAYRAAAISRYAYLKKPISVIFLNEHEMGETYIKMRLKAYVVDTRFEFQFKSDMTETMIKALQKMEIFVANA